MRNALLILALLSLLTLATSLVWLAQRPDSPTKGPATTQSASLRIGLIPERDIFEQRRAFRALAEYLEPKINCPVQLVTNNTYEGVLKDLQDRQIDAAFLGSLVALLAVDRDNAQVILKSESDRGLSTYAGTIFVPKNSPIHSLADLRGKRLAAVPTTTAGAIFPACLFTQARIAVADQPRTVWIGTHDDVIREVAAGNVDAGAVKDLRLDAYEKGLPDSFRRLATSPRMPDNALVLRADLPPQVVARLQSTLLDMHNNPQGVAVLAQLNLHRFLPTSLQEYAGLYDMLELIGPQWPTLSIPGPAPKRPPGIASTFQQK